MDASLIDDVNNDGHVFIFKNQKTRIKGIKYYLNKTYTIEDGKRIFDKKKVYYTSNYRVDSESEGVYIDESHDIPLIVDFV